MNLTDLQLSFIHNLLYNKEWVYNEEKESLKLTTEFFLFEKAKNICTPKPSDPNTH